MIGVSGVVAVYASGCLLACAIIAISGVAAAWLAALIAGQGRYRGHQGKGIPMTAPEIQLEIERTRERLGETVDELAAKADVKARARAKAAEMKAKAQVKAAEVSGQMRQSQMMPGQVAQRRWPVVAAAATAVVIGSIVVWRRRKG